MKKRTFLKLSSTLATGVLLAPLSSCVKNETVKLKNWAGNLTYSTANVDYPANIEQIQALVKKYNKLKVLGSQHCFNTIADSTDNLVSMKNFNKVISLDEKAKTVTVEAGIRYGILAEYLVSKGFALHNLASLPHISVAGACATATHGSGVKNGNLATAVSGLEMVLASGEIKTLTREKDGEAFLAAVVGLGALGVVTKVTLDIQPNFQVQQVVYENLPFAALETHFDEIMSSGYSVSLFTDWQNNNVSEVWVKSKITAPSEFLPIGIPTETEGVKLDIKKELFGAKLATKNLHPIAELNAENCTDQMGVPSDWHNRLPHFKMGFTPSSGKELQSEYFIPRENAFKAMQALNKLGDKWKADLMISEIRTIAADDLWMSTAYKRESVAIHFTWKQTDNVIKLLPLVEAELAPFGVRPHWGKLFTRTTAELKAVYPKFDNFVNLVKQYDPNGKFHNKFLDILTT